MLYWRIIRAAGPMALLAAIAGSVAYILRCLEVRRTRRQVVAADEAARKALSGGWRGESVGLKWEAVKPALDASLVADDALEAAVVGREIASRKTVRALADKLGLGPVQE